MSSLATNWRERLGPVRVTLERDWLPAWIGPRRWFQAKSRGVTRVELRDGAAVLLEPGATTFWLIADVWSGPNDPATYQVPLTLWLGSPDGLDPAAIVARTVIDERPVLLVDALTTPEPPRWLVGRIGEASVLDTERGRFAGEPTRAFGSLAAGSLDPVRLSRAEQSHSNVILGDRLLLKVFRKLSEGINPDVEITRALTERTPFRNMPALAGSIAYTRHDDLGPKFAHAAMLQQFVPSQGQGWEWMLARLAELYDALIVGTPGQLDASRRATLDDVAILARRTAEMHQALASIRDDPDFTPVDFNVDDWRLITEQIRRQAEITRRSLAGSDIPGASRVLDRVDAWLAGQDRNVDLAALGQKHRVHGDLHLGQTLRTRDDFIVLDFEGEPGKPISERRQKQTPLRDLAGMLRSFDYAAFAALDAALPRYPGHEPELARAARDWSDHAAARFVELYTAHSGAPEGLSPARRALLDRLLLEKALYELDYELNNRPGWASIPLRGLETRLGS